MSTSLNEYFPEWVLHWLNISLNEYFTEWVLNWLSTSQNEYITEWVHHRMSTTMNEYFTEWVLNWLSTSLNEYITEWVHHWMSTSQNEYFTGRVFHVSSEALTIQHAAIRNQKKTFLKSLIARILWRFLNKLIFFFVFVSCWSCHNSISKILFTQVEQGSEGFLPTHFFGIVAHAQAGFNSDSNFCRWFLSRWAVFGGLFLWSLSSWKQISCWFFSRLPFVSAVNFSGG